MSELTDAIRAKRRGDYSMIGTWPDKTTFDSKPWPMWGDAHIDALIEESDGLKQVLYDITKELVRVTEPGANADVDLIQLRKRAYELTIAMTDGRISLGGPGSPIADSDSRSD